jgi:hypothetical protein
MHSHGAAGIPPLAAKEYCNVAKKVDTTVVTDQTSDGTVAGPSESDGLTAATEHANDQAALTDQVVPAGDVATSGVRARRAWTMKNFLPHPDWINQNVTPEAIGTHRLVGRVVGEVQKAERRTNTVVKGSKQEQIVSIALIGLFTAIDLAEAQSTFSMLFLPMAFAEQIEAALAMEGVTSVPLDVDIGLEKTGRTIPYEWTVTSYLEGRAQRALRQMVASRRTGSPARAAAPRLIADGSAG